MIHIKRIGWFLYKIWFGLAFFITFLPQYPFYYVLTRRYKDVKWAFEMKHWWSTMFQFVVFIFVKKRHVEPLPKRPYVICCNHMSYLDITLMPLVIPDFFVFMGKSELLKWPLLNIFFKNGNFDIAVTRDSIRGSARAMEAARKAIDHGRSVVIFPEGTIGEGTQPKMLRFKNGAFKLAIEKQVPIVPVTYLTNWKLFGEPFSYTDKARPGISKVVIHKAIETKGMTDKDLVSLREQTYAVIDNELMRYEGR